jgi:hypothetical protein
MATEMEDDEADGPTKSTAFAAVVKLSFLTAGFALAALYVKNTYGQIRLENLYYPYMVVSLLVVFGLTVYIQELHDLYHWSPDLDFAESLRLTYEEWRRSIGFVVVGIVYIYLIDIIGFFIASALGMVALMLIGGLRDPKQILLVTAVVLGLVYGLFIRVMGLQPPSGAFGL